MSGSFIYEIGTECSTDFPDSSEEISHHLFWNGLTSGSDMALSFMNTIPWLNVGDSPRLYGNDYLSLVSDGDCSEGMLALRRDRKARYDIRFFKARQLIERISNTYAIALDFPMSGRDSPIWKESGGTLPPYPPAPPGTFTATSSTERDHR